MSAVRVAVALVGLVAWSPPDAGPDECPPAADAEHRQVGLEAFRAAQVLLAAGDWDGAAERFAAAARLDPLFALAPYGLGQAHMGAKRPARAVEAFAQCRDAFRCLASATAGERAEVQKRVDGQIRELRDALRSVERERLLTGAIKWKQANNQPTGRAITCPT